jgi:2-phospho-L-lactate guanylyltransferase
VKSPARSKERLKHALSQRQREELARTMFEHALVETLKVRGLDRVIVVANDAQILVVAAAAGALVLVEGEQNSHGVSADWAARECMKRGADNVMFLPIDVPLVQAAEIEELLAASRKLESPHLVIVPSRDGTGTNAMVRTPPDLIESRFGPDSFAIHVAQAEAKEAKVAVLRPEGLVNDLDDRADLSLFLAGNPAGRVADLLREFRKSGTAFASP